MNNHKVICRRALFLLLYLFLLLLFSLFFKEKTVSFPALKLHTLGNKMVKILLTFQRIGASFRIFWVMSSFTLYAFTTVLILKATWYFLHQSRTFCKQRRCSFPYWYRPIRRFVSSLKLSHDTARMSRNSPKNTN